MARNFSIFGKSSRNVRGLKIATSRNFVRKFVRNFTSFAVGAARCLAFGLNRNG